jgi:purine-binding chemotaxis protein CheW
MERQIVVFGLANENYGVDIDSVESIVNLLPITAVPDAPDFVEGVANLRGEVLPVIDLRKRLGLPLMEQTRDTRIVVAEVEGSKVGMKVDQVSEVLRVAEDAVEPPSPMVASVDSDSIVGIAKAEERLIVLLNLAELLSTRGGDPTGRA